ncbi:hypothetical protein Cgig2_034081 [Carnegiea gigantea]|uniref:Uncharacterized protein n=1 Tax=Carnegiea gigantea TaxID=171969 RepID=A0A9Q1K0Z6_9CARY|nr:hypothetical protein Cgig2_034081 [Carnegiea gigantea]
MSNLRANSRTKKQTTLTNEYENERISRIRENKLKLQSLGIKHITTSLTSLMDDTNAKRAKGKQKSQMDNDVEYVPCCNDADEELNSAGNELRAQELDHASTLLKKKQQRAVVGDEALKKVAAAFKAVEQVGLVSCGIAMSNQQQLDENITANDEETNEQLFAENIYGDTHGFLDEQEFFDDDYDHVNLEINGVDQESGTRQTVEALNLSSGNQAGSNEERRPINPDQNLTSMNQGTGNNESELNAAELRKNAILRHAKALFRDSRHKLKRKYFDNPKLKTKADWMKNRPAYMLDVDWKYLVNLWSSPEFQKQKCGRECSRLDLMLKSRTRTSDKPINAENLANNMHAKAAMEKLKNEREQGLNNKTDEQIFQEVLGKDKHGYLRAYGRGKSITDYFGVKPSRLDLAQDVMELKKRADASIMEAKKDVEEARKEAEQAKLEAEQAKKEAKEARKEAETTR